MIQFPETASTEWKIVADAANAEKELRARIRRATLIENEKDRLAVRHYAGLELQAEIDAEMTPSLEMFTLAQFQSSPLMAPTDMIEGVLKRDGLCLVLGPSGSGKSTQALQMLHSLLTGNDWMGQPVGSVVGAVGILSYDMDASITADWMNGFPGVNPSKVAVVNAHKRGNPLAVPQFRAQIASHWKALGVKVIVVDSFSASFFGHDENDAAQTQAYYRDMKKFALTECEAEVVIVIVHSTEASPHKARGSTVQHDAADSIVGVSVDSNQARHIKMIKYRQHRDATTGQMTNQMTPVVITAPDATTHLSELDVGAMSLAGMHLPTTVVAQAFPDLPEADEKPNTDSHYEGDDDL